MKVLIILLASLPVAVSQSDHNEYRGYKCSSKERGGGTDCVLTMRRHRDDVDETTLKANRDCFPENGPDGNERLYCPMYCPGAFAGFFIAKVPAANTKCIKFLTYKVESRDDDWFFWRSGACLNEPLQFELGCSFKYAKSDVKDLKQFVNKKSRNN